MTELARRLTPRFEPAPMRVPFADIGGGRVVRRFRMGGEYVKVGTLFTGDQIRALPPTNRQVLIDRYFSVWPVPAVGIHASAATTGSKRAERHVVSLGFRNYAVIEGRKLNDQPITDRDAAFALAGRPAPKQRRRK